MKRSTISAFLGGEVDLGSTAIFKSSPAKAVIAT